MSVKVGEIVTYVTSTREEQPALVTAVWSPTCINVVVINPDEDQTDTYGRKIQRFTSVSHESLQNFGNYWK